MKLNILLFLSLSALLSSCDPTPVSKNEMQEAWVPVYTTNTAGIKTITAGHS